MIHMQIYVKDVWKEYTGWPLNDMEGQYKFMVKHVQLWKFAFHGTSPRWIHSIYLAAIAAFYAKYECLCPINPSLAFSLEFRSVHSSCPKVGRLFLKLI